MNKNKLFIIVPNLQKEHLKIALEIFDFQDRKQTETTNNSCLEKCCLLLLYPRT